MAAYCRAHITFTPTYHRNSVLWIVVVIDFQLLVGERHDDRTVTTPALRPRVELSHAPAAHWEPLVVRARPAKERNFHLALGALGFALFFGCAVGSIVTRLTRLTRRSGGLALGLGCTSIGVGGVGFWFLLVHHHSLVPRLRCIYDVHKPAHGELVAPHRLARLKLRPLSCQLRGLLGVLLRLSLSRRRGGICGGIGRGGGGVLGIKRGQAFVVDAEPLRRPKLDEAQVYLRVGRRQLQDLGLDERPTKIHVDGIPCLHPRGGARGSSLTV